MKTTILLCSLLFLIGCDHSKTPKVGPKPLDSPDSSDSPIIISDNSSSPLGRGAMGAATAITFKKENHIRVYGPNLLAAKVAKYQPTWLEVVGVTTATSGCTPSTHTPSATPTTNCLAGATSWNIAITPATVPASLSWDGTNEPNKVSINLTGSPQFVFSNDTSSPPRVITTIGTPASITGATLSFGGGTPPAVTYACRPCTIKVHYKCTDATGATCGN